MVKVRGAQRAVGPRWRACAEQKKAPARQQRGSTAGQWAIAMEWSEGQGYDSLKGSAEAASARAPEKRQQDWQQSRRVLRACGFGMCLVCAVRFRAALFDVQTRPDVNVTFCCEPGLHAIPSK